MSGPNCSSSRPEREPIPAGEVLVPTRTVDQKRCYICRKEKPLSEFNKQSARRDGLSCYCRSCDNARQRRSNAKNRLRVIVPIDEKTCRRCKLKKPASEFSSLRRNRDGLSGWCKVCAGEVAKKWRDSLDPKTRKARYRDFYLRYEAPYRSRRSEPGYRQAMSDQASRLWSEGWFRDKASSGMRRFWAGLTYEEKLERTAQLLANPPKKAGTSLEMAVESVLIELGVEFKPQEPVHSIPVDFYIPTAKLIIECDGTYWHDLPGRRQRDRRRDYWLRSKGFHVLRLEEDVIKSGSFRGIVQERVAKYLAVPS